MPVGKKLPYQTLRVEGMFEKSRARRQQVAVGFGIGKSFDLEVRSSKLAGDRGEPAIDLSYNFVSPVVGFAPGISFGVLDGLNRTQDGRRGYVAVTFRQGLAVDFIQNSALEFTFGGQFGSRNSGFMGVWIPFTSNVRILAEHDGIRITAGAEYQWTRELTSRVLYRDRDAYATLAWVRRF